MTCGLSHSVAPSAVSLGGRNVRVLQSTGIQSLLYALVLVFWPLVRECRNPLGSLSTAAGQVLGHTTGLGLLH